MLLILSFINIKQHNNVNVNVLHKSKYHMHQDMTC